MVVLALILLVLVAVLVVAIVVSNPEVYDLSIFGAVVPANAAGIFITGAVAMAVTILAILLLRTGMRRARARRTERKVLLQAAGDKVSGSSAKPEKGSTTTSKTSDISATSDSDTTDPTTTTSTEPTTTRSAKPPTTTTSSSKEASSLDLGESSTTPAERQAMLDEADALTKDEPQR
jgi:cytoskeletal protein RodZ